MSEHDSDWMQDKDYNSDGEESLETEDIMVKNETVTEMQAITTMIKLAKEKGLETEVIWSFSQGAKLNFSIEAACQYALSEWDI